MEIHEHNLAYSNDAPPDYSQYFNYLDYTFNVKVSQACEGGEEFTVRYYWEEELSGVLRFKYSIIEGFSKPIKQKVVLLVDAACDKLIGHIILDLNVPQEELVNMSNALQIHATRKVKEYVIHQDSLQ